MRNTYLSCLDNNRYVTLLTHYNKLGHMLDVIYEITAQENNNEIQCYSIIFEVALN